MQAKSIPNNSSKENSYSYFDNFFVKSGIQLGKITPAFVAAGLTGFYILGYAYANGWMMAIDQIAIKIMRHYDIGYMAIGALMPTVQWYAAWGVRTTAGIAAGLFFELMRRVMILSIRFFAPDEVPKTKLNQIPVLA